MIANTVIQTHDLTKRYHGRPAVDQLNLTIRDGEIFGFLGPNGAAKTTTILMLLGLTEPSSGSVEVLGYNPTRQPLEVKRHVGCLPENVGYYRDMTARQNMRYVARLNRIDVEQTEQRIEQSLERVGLLDEADKLVAAYSRGMRQRLGLAELLLKQPRVMILDEPTLGLDPEGITSMLDLIRHLSQQEHITVVLCSHLLHQVQRICDRVGIMNSGRLMAAGTIDELSEQGLKDAMGRRLSLEEIYLHYFQET